MAWVFGNSSCHNAYSQDALVAMHMNARSGALYEGYRVARKGPIESSGHRSL